jgi:hypothetical protein
MDEGLESNVEPKIAQYLRWHLRYRPEQVGNVIYFMRQFARAVGYNIDGRFAFAGLGSGPEAKMSSEIAGRAIGSGAYSTGEGAMRRWINQLLEQHAPRFGTVV